MAQSIGEIVKEHLNVQLQANKLEDFKMSVHDIINDIDKYDLNIHQVKKALHVLAYDDDHDEFMEVEP